jgi:CheY-like chemotaxis protein
MAPPVAAQPGGLEHALGPWARAPHPGRLTHRCCSGGLRQRIHGFSRARTGALPHVPRIFLAMSFDRVRANLAAMSAHLRLAPARSGDQDPDRAELPIRVVLADDHAPVRRSLRQLLDGEAGVEVVAEAADLPTVVRHVHWHTPHVLVLDLRMPDGSSIETIRRLREQAPETEIVAVTMEPSPAFAQRALAAGAVGFVLKDSAATELPAAVRCAARCEEYVSPRVAAGLDVLRSTVGREGLSRARGYDAS